MAFTPTRSSSRWPRWTSASFKETCDHHNNNETNYYWTPMVDHNVDNNKVDYPRNNYHHNNNAKTICRIQLWTESDCRWL